MDFLGAACDIHLVLLHVCQSQSSALCIHRACGARERAISLFCTDGTSAVATLEGTVDKTRSEEEELWFVPLCVRVLLCFLSWPGVAAALSKATGRSSSLTNRAKLWDKGAAHSSHFKAAYPSQRGQRQM